MPRPTTKTDLIKAANEQFVKVWKLVDSMTSDKQNKEFNFGHHAGRKEAHRARDNNLRDVLIHLYECHYLLLNWVKSNQNGEAKPFLLEPYSWKTYGDMYVELWKKHQDTPCDQSIEMINASHPEVMTLIETFSNDELFLKGSFAWTGGSTLGSLYICHGKPL